MTGVIDPDGQYGGPIIKNQMPPERLRWKTYAERLEEASISWRVYQHGDRDLLSCPKESGAQRGPDPGGPV
jgi:phospholipase C